MRFLPTDLPVPLSPARRRALIGALAFTQMTAWGTTFYAPSVLGPVMGAEVGLSPEIQFGGVTLMLLVAAALSPAAGRHIERHGARGAMALGTLLVVGALVLMARCSGPVGYLAGWVLAGAATPLCMSNAAFAAVAQGYPGDGRRAINLLMLMSGLSSGVYWPLTGWLEAAVGWRDTLLLFALLHLLVCLPLHVVLVRRGASDVVRGASGEVPAPVLPVDARRSAFWLIVVGAGFSGLASWGMPLQFIPLFTEAGMPAQVAITVAALQSPAAMLARIVELATGSRVPAVSLVTYASGLAPFVLAGLWFALVPPMTDTAIALTTGFVVLYGFCTALITFARSTVPLELFGPSGYAILLGRLSLWLNIAFALSPLLFAALRQAGGYQAVLAAGVFLAAVAGLAFSQLERVTARARQAPA